MTDKNMKNDQDESPSLSVPSGCFYLTIDPLSLPPPDDAAIAAAAKHTKKRRRYAAPLQPAPPPGVHQPMTYQPAAYGYPMPQLDLPPAEAVKPKDYLTFNVLVAAFCCLLPGLVAVVRSRQVRRAVTAGREEEARAASLSARRWGLGTLCLGVFVNTGLVALLLMKVYFSAEVFKED